MPGHRAPARVPDHHGAHVVGQDLGGHAPEGCEGVFQTRQQRVLRGVKKSFTRVRLPVNPWARISSSNTALFQQPCWVRLTASRSPEEIPLAAWGNHPGTLGK